MKQYTEEEQKELHEKLIISRLLAIKKTPYYRRGLLSLIPVSTPGLQTFATDTSWRMYYDPEVVEAWTKEEIAAAWLHELGHQLRDHATRFKNTGESSKYASFWNIAGDAGINTDLREIGVILADPDRRYYSDVPTQYPGWKRGMTTEELYRIVKEQEGVDDDDQGEGEPENSDGESEDSEGSQDSDGNTQGEGEESDEDDNASGGSESDQNDDDAQPSGEDSSDPSEGDTSDTEGLAGEGSSSQQADKQGEYPSCGSAADNIPQPYERDETDDDGGLSETQAEKLREEVSKDIINHEKQFGYGSVPGGIVREAEELLKPKTNWKAELRKLTRKFMAYWAGQQDFSMSRRSSRSPKDIIMPGSVDADPPVIVVVIDTSGSMRPKDLGVALAEIRGLLKRAGGHQGIRIINCDAGANTPVTINKSDYIDLTGGGGTDMRVGIAAAAALTPTPDLIITITDGGTPWPQEPDKNAPKARQIALVTTDKNINETEKLSFRIPKFIKPIFANTNLYVK